MDRTHLSLYYLAGYLIPAGLLLLLIPDTATKLLLSNQIIRFRLQMLYPTTVVVRLLISATLIWLYLRTSDPFFLVVLTIVVIGIVLTASSLLLDRRRGAASP